MVYPVITPEERREKLRIPSGKIRLVLDTDAKNEVDDQFAIVWALLSQERFQVEAMYAAPFSHDCLARFFTSGDIRNASGLTYAEDPASGMQQSYEEIRKLYQMLGLCPEHRVFRGSATYLQGDKPVASEAAQDLAARAMAGSEPLYVVATGAATNIASAILQNPDTIRKIVVVWLGGQPLAFGHGIEFNLMQDVRAAQVLFESGVPLVHIPCMNVASHLTVSKDEIENHVMTCGAVGRYLGQSVLDAFANPQGAIRALPMFRKSYLLGREDADEGYFAKFHTEHVAWSRTIWDISAVAFLKNPAWTPSTLVPAPALGEDMRWKEKGYAHEIRAVNYCYRDMIFGDLFACIRSFAEKGGIVQEGEGS